VFKGGENISENTNIPYLLLIHVVVLKQT